MNNLLAFCFNCCDPCVRLTRTLLRKHQIIDWWKIEALLIHHHTVHYTPRKTLQIYPSMMSLPDNNAPEISGLVTVHADILPIGTKTLFHYEVKNSAPLSFRWIQGECWKLSENCWLEFQLILDKDGCVYGRLSVTDTGYPMEEIIF